MGPGRAPAGSVADDGAGCLVLVAERGAPVGGHHAVGALAEMLADEGDEPLDGERVRAADGDGVAGLGEGVVEGGVGGVEGGDVVGRGAVLAESDRVGVASSGEGDAGAVEGVLFGAVEEVRPGEVVEVGTREVALFVGLGGEGLGDGVGRIGEGLAVGLLGLALGAVAGLVLDGFVELGEMIAHPGGTAGECTDSGDLVGVAVEGGDDGTVTLGTGGLVVVHGSGAGMRCRKRRAPTVKNQGGLSEGVRRASLAGGGVADVLGVVTRTLGPLSASVHPLTGVLGAVTKALRGVTGPLGGVSGSLQALTGGLQGLTDDLGALTRSLEGLTGFLSGLTRTLEGLTKAVKTPSQFGAGGSRQLVWGVRGYARIGPLLRHARRYNDRIPLFCGNGLPLKYWLGSSHHHMIYPDTKRGIVGSAAGALVMTCPKCGRDGTFTRAPVNTLHVGEHTLNIRVCPNPQCQTVVYVITDSTTGGVLASYPPLRIDFDASDVPERVVKSLDEAITCHADSCYIAAAIMVRRVLEEICEDQGASGNNLKARVAALGSQIVIPQQLLDGMDELRLLGNDAAHVEARLYDEIGSREVEVAIRFTKEILKAVYQYTGLLRELQSLKPTPPGTAAA